MAEVVGTRVRGFLRNRWLVFVAAMWMQSCAGVGYLFGSLSPVIKASLGYSQRQLAALGVAKDLGDSVGFLAGTLCAVLPLWAALLVGAAQNLVGYGWVWLAVTRRAPVPPLWAVRHLPLRPHLVGSAVTLACPRLPFAAASHVFFNVSACALLCHWLKRARCFAPSCWR
jgi:hypothetical protein